MKGQDIKLTLQETEHLCRLYMVCRLSVLEETELRYFLTQVDYHSPLIDEVRQIMDIDTCVSVKPLVDAGIGKKKLFRKRPLYWSVAASIAIVFAFAISFFMASTRGYDESSNFYIAYVDGHRLNDTEAKSIVEAGQKSADDFIRRMAEIEMQEQQKIDNFFNR